ncbi:hypothetical protein TrCOL_g8467, partial [Triparma columacea]
MGTSSLLSLASNYVNWDPNMATRLAVSDILQSSDFKEDDLKPLFEGRLSFGTAGLRAPFGPGYNCMNDLTVTQTAQGLLKYLEESGTGVKERGIVVGYDHRASKDFTPYDLSSENFAKITAAVFESQGIPVYLYGGLVATPLVPFGVERVGAACGVMVTASHNPKEDTGYKVYWGNGAQIISPHDEGIAGKILENLEPWGEYNLGCVSTWEAGGEVEGEYFDKMREVCCSRVEGGGEATPLTYTAMHGVGHSFAKRAFKTFGLKHFVSVAEQQEPDPTFRTVAFPNPEEGEGALKLAMETAEKAGSKVIIANDPDADRLAVAERRPGEGWRLFSGNEIGWVLGHWMWRKAVRERMEAAEGAEGGGIAMLASTVSSKFLGAVAKKEGFLFEETLTGFKWMGNRSEELRAEGYNVVFAYEEAIGYCCGNVVKDKDGVTAAAVLGELVVELEREGKSIADLLVELKEEYGYFVSKNGYVKFYEKEVLEDIFQGVRRGGKYVDEIGGVKVVGVRDLTTGYDSAAEDLKSKLPKDGGTQFVTFTMENGGVVSLRTSGTEPKLKYYVEVAG